MRRLIFSCFLTVFFITGGYAETLRLESDTVEVSVDTSSGRWVLVDKRSQTKWPTEGQASCGTAWRLKGGFEKSQVINKDTIRLVTGGGRSVEFALVEGGSALELRYQRPSEDNIRVPGDLLAISGREGGCVIVPCREGLLIPSDNGKSFKRVFGTSDYEGCHMNMLGFIKGGSALIVTWDDAYVFPEVQSTVVDEKSDGQKLSVSFELRRSAQKLRLQPLGKGDWNTIATEYRAYAEKQGLAITLREKIRRDPHVELLAGASNAKLWTCLARRMNEESTKEESVRVRWTFEEAAKIAEHLRNDLGIDRCLFMMGGWTEGGYDCRHPDNLPANPECGGNKALTDAIKRIQALDYVACLHDNVQDMYRDAKSWDPSYIEKNPDGSLIKGGRWLGGRAYMVCAPKQLELAQRPQNLPAIKELFSPWSYFIDTTYAMGPRQCYDPSHPIGRNDDIAWKIKLSDYARGMFGIFGSECGREWALPHSDFFEGLVGVSGRYYHNLKPNELGAMVIPFWEMVYHDCQICFGKYGYSRDKTAEYVAHHILCARPLHYHSFPDHLYWESKAGQKRNGQIPAAGCYTRCDSGWAEGMHPLDIFIKNTHEILGPLHRNTAHDRLTRFEYVTEDRMIRRAIYGRGENATKVIVNFGKTDAKVSSVLGGDVILPPWGFLIEGPFFAGFYARSWSGEEYDKGALFTFRPLDKKPLQESGRIRIFHAFGPPAIRWKNTLYNVVREKVVP